MSTEALDNYPNRFSAGDGQQLDGADEASSSILPLPQHLAATLRDMIIRDELKPGDRIRERQLSEQLNVSRTPLREAIRILVGEKLVDTLPNKGAVVASPDPEEVRQLLEVLGGLEALGGQLAAINASDEQISEISALHHEMVSAYYRKDKFAYFKLNQSIHKAIVVASGNLVLVETHQHLNARLYRVRYRSNQRNDRWHEAIEQHERILDALQARDANRLADMMRSHLGETWSKAREVGFAD